MRELRYWGPLMLLATAGYLSVSLARYAQLGASVFDLGIHYQTVWLLGRGLDPELSTRGLQAFADHFNPVAGLFAPLTWLWDSPLVLLLAQAWLLALAGVPLYFLARQALPVGLAAAICLMLWLQPCLLYLNRFDFHFAVVLVPASLLAAWGLENGRSRVYAGSLLLLLATTESAGFTVLFLAPVATRLRGWRWGLATAVAGVAGMVLAAWSLRVYGSGLPTQYLSLYSRWGATPGQILGNLLSHPGLVLSMLWAARAYWLTLLLGFLGLPLLSPLRCLPVLPVLAGNLLSYREHQLSLELHYDAAIVGFLAWAAVAGLRVVRPPALVAGLVALNLGWVYLSGPLYPPRAWEPLAPRPPDWDRVAAQIPAEASVAADNLTGTRLAGRTRLFLLPNPFYPLAWGNRPQALVETTLRTRPGMPGELRRGLDEADVDYVLASFGGHPFPERETDRWLMLYAVLLHRAYGVLHLDGRLLLSRRGAPWSDHREKLLLREFSSH